MSELTLYVISLIIGIIGVCASSIASLQFIRAKRALHLKLRLEIDKLETDIMRHYAEESKVYERDTREGWRELQHLYEKALQHAVDELDDGDKERIVSNLQSLSKKERKNFVTELLRDAGVKAVTAQ